MINTKLTSEDICGWTLLREKYSVDNHHSIFEGGIYAYSGPLCTYNTISAKPYMYFKGETFTDRQMILFFRKNYTEIQYLNDY